MVLAQSPDRSSDGGDIVVTAQKRAERLLDTPQSVTAISADDLSRLNAVQFRDFANSVPALSYSTAGAGQTQITLRGVTTGNDIGPTVGIYVDDVPYGSSSAFSNASSLALDAGLFDMSQVEILRGPQGTLYGASTMGGLIKYVTARPDAGKLGGSAQVGISDTKDGGISYNAAAAINTPIVTDKVALRTSGFFSRDGGFIDNEVLGQKDVNRSRIYGGRADLLVTPTEALSIRLSGYLQNIHRNGTAAADFDFSGNPVDGALSQERQLTEPFEQRFRLVSSAIDYDFGGATLTSITSYQSMNARFRQDASPVYVPLLGLFGFSFGAVGVEQERRTKKFTQEVRLTSNGSGPIDWMVGGFYTDEKSGNMQLIVPYALDGSIAPINLATISIPSRYRELAGFGNLTWHVTDRFDVSGGLRWAENRQRFEQIGSGLLIGSTPQTRSKDDVVTYLANARYRFSNHATAYLRYATGYRPGGPNFVVNDPITGFPLADAVFASDSLDSFEAGFKAETADRTFGIDLSGYYIDWKNIQIATAAGGVSVIANAGGAHITGAEVSLTARPTRTLTATTAFAYQHARLADDSVDLGALKGDRLPNVPKYSLTLNVDYKAPETSAWRPIAGATFRFVSDRSSSFDGNAGVPQYELPNYAAVDLRAGVSIGAVDAQLFVRNLFDKRGPLSAATVLSALGGPAQVSMLQPRTIGLSATSRF
jgi:outer membrane receptor protein involved in Fe transport